MDVCLSTVIHTLIIHAITQAVHTHIYRNSGGSARYKVAGEKLGKDQAYKYAALHVHRLAFDTKNQITQVTTYFSLYEPEYGTNLTSAGGILPYLRHSLM